MMLAARPQPRPPAARTRRISNAWLSACLGIAGAVYAIQALVFFPRWLMDDAYISFRYAQNLALHGQLVWNLGADRVEGYTGIALPLMLALGDKLSLPPELTTRFIGIGSFAAAGVMMALVLRRLGVGPVFIGTVLLLYVCAPMMYTHAMGGLETTLFSAALVTCLLMLLRWQAAAHDSRRQAALLLTLLFTSLIRPEGALLAVISIVVIFAWMIRRGDQPRGFVLRTVAFYIGPGLIYFIWRFWYYGELLPNTFYVKASGSANLDSLANLGNFIGAYCLLPVAAALICWQVASRNRLHGASSPAPDHRLPWIVIGSFSLLLVAFYARSTLIQNISYRFFAPFFALALVAAAVVIDRNLRRLDARSRRRAWALVGVLVAVQLLRQVLWLPGEAARADAYQRVLTTEHLPAGQYLADHVPSGQWIAVVDDAGAIPYVSGLRAIDMGALNDRTLATGHLSQQQRLDYLFSFQPGAIVLTSRNLDRVEGLAQQNAVAGDTRFAAYRLVRAFSPGGQLYGRPYYELVFLRGDLVRN
jgi:arabinofuranosyltransferase